MADDRRVFGNRYEIIRHIARGGMAQVYLARDLLLDRPVALKALFPELSVDEAFVERFRREAQAAANLSHPNIVSIYDWGQGGNTYYIVMEFVDGETLSARIRRGPVPADEAATIAIATAAALSFAHDHNVIHRDVKPGNVLIDRSGHVKVADFGIARAVGAAERITQAGAVMGTATYFSPEQAQGHNVDARSDVYSLGVVLYEMAVGKPPFQGDNPVAIAYKHVGEAPPSPRSINPAIPPGYEAITLKAMAKDPADRYQTAAALRLDLEKFRAGQPVLAAARVAAAGAGGSRMASDATIAMTPATSAIAAGAADVTHVSRPVTTTTLSPPREAATTRGGPYVDEETGPLSVGRSRTRLYVILLILLLVILAAIGFFIGRSYGYFGGVKTLTVPSVASRPAAAAQTALRAAGFTDVAVKKATSATVRVGDAITTVPAAGSREKANHLIELDISIGPSPVQVPTVTGEAQAAAVATLTQSHFTPVVIPQADNNVLAGHVIGTVPPDGTLQAPGSRVQVLVSSGPIQVTIPNVTNDPPVQAGAVLSGLGFKVTEKSEASDTVPSGEVTRTAPGGGSTAPHGSAVTVYVSTGPAVVTLPSLLGKTQDQAASNLARLGLIADFVSVPVDLPGQNGRVQLTNPLPGISVDKGSTVVVSVGSYIAPTTTTSTSTTTSTTTTTPTTTAPPQGGPIGLPVGATPGGLAG